MSPKATKTTSPRSDERGAAMVEFALVSLLFVMLLAGLITFGLILSFKQNLTQAAAEGARAGATAPVGDAAAEAATATDDAVDSFGQACGVDGLQCTFVEEDCGEQPGDGIDDPAVENCITVTLVYDYDGFPILPNFPVISAFYPSTLTSASTAEVNS